MWRLFRRQLEQQLQNKSTLALRKLSEGKSFAIKMNSTEDKPSLDMEWVASLEKEVSDTKFRDRNTMPTIYRVPDILKMVDPQAYHPLLVSLGPYHRDRCDQRAMNQLKWKCLKFVLQRNTGVALVEYLDRIKKLETRARDAYSEEVKMSSNNFAEMMLLDGCFVMLTVVEPTYMFNILGETTLPSLSVAVRDIFMLENQLPFIILETLYECAYPSGIPFRNLTAQFISKHIPTYLQHPSPNGTFHHIIHLCLSCIDPTTNRGNSNGDGVGDGNQSSAFGSLHCSKLVKTVLGSKLFSSLLSQVNKIRTARDANRLEDVRVSASQWIPSANVFNEAGIHFEKKKKAKSFLDITFHNGKLQIPQLEIDDNTNLVLRNLIAYEQCSISIESKFYVTSYAQFMDCLINAAADVELLQQHEIIISWLGYSQVVATLFNKLCTHIEYDMNNFYLADVVKAMTKHRNTRCNKWRAKLNHDYFSNPWAIISLFGALVLFLLTVIQTIYAALSYGRSSN